MPDFSAVGYEEAMHRAREIVPDLLGRAQKCEDARVLLPENEKLAAVDAVRLTFERAALSEADLFKLDLDAGYLDRHLRAGDPARLTAAGL